MNSTTEPADAPLDDSAPNADTPADAVEPDMQSESASDAEAVTDAASEPDAVTDAASEAEPEPDSAAVADSVPEPVVDPDPALLESHDLALAALREITPAATIGDPADYRIEPDGVVSLRFANRLPGYPGWFWTVSLARVEGAEPTVLEVELIPGDGALLAPDWVPWAVRLADYQAAQVALAEAPHAVDDDESDEDDDDLDDVDDLDAADFDDDGSPILHAGDVDGVDIDELDEDADDDEDDDESDDDSDESDDDDDSEDEDEDEESDDDESDDDDSDDESDDDDSNDEDDDAER